MDAKTDAATRVAQLKEFVRLLHNALACAVDVGASDNEASYSDAKTRRDFARDACLHYVTRITAPTAHAAFRATSEPTGVLAEVAAERARQDAKWGGAAHDDTHDGLDWFTYRAEREPRAMNDHTPLVERRAALVEIAALAVAQLESLDRKQGASAIKMNSTDSQVIPTSESCADTQLLDAVELFGLVIGPTLGGFEVRDDHARFTFAQHKTWRKAALGGLRAIGGLASRIAEQIEHDEQEALLASAPHAGGRTE